MSEITTKFLTQETKINKDTNVIRWKETGLPLDQIETRELFEAYLITEEQWEATDEAHADEVGDKLPEWLEKLQPATEALKSVGFQPFGWDYGTITVIAPGARGQLTFDEESAMEFVRTIRNNSVAR